MYDRNTRIASTRLTISLLFLVLALIFMTSNTRAQNNTIALSSEGTLVSSKQIKIQLDKVSALVKKKDYAAAELIMDALLSDMNALQNTSMLIDVYTMAGKLNYKQKNYNDAVTQYEKAISVIEGDDDKSQKLLASLYHEIAQCYKHLENLPQSINYYQKSLLIQQTRKDSLAIAIALKNIAMAENKQKNYIRALDHAQRSLDILSSDSTSLRYAQVLLTTGIIYRNIGHYEKSLDYIQQAKMIYEQQNDVRHLAEVDNQIGLIYTNLQQLNNAKSFYTQTIDLPIEQVKSETRAAAFRELGVINSLQNNLPESIDMLTTALDIYQSINKLSKTTRIYLLLGRSYLDQEKPIMATRYFDQSLALAIEYEQIEFQIQSLNYLGQITLDKDIEQAIVLFERALTLSSEVDAKADEMNTYHWLKESEKMKGNLDKSLEYSEKIYQLSQVIQKERENIDFTKNQVILASYKLESELKGLRENAELNALKLNKQQNELAIMKQLQQISDLEIKKNSFANLLLITVLSVFSILALYILYQYRNTRARNRELDYLASRDPLTNCYNRRILYLRFNKSFGSEEAPQQYAVVLADIDSFKAINDTHGHTTGDKVLQGVAKILLDNTSESDTVARFGGEEFCILLPNSSEQEAEEIAEKIRQKIEDSHYESIKVTCSFGVASLDNDVECNLTLIERADMALYQSKYQGRNRVSVWEHQLIESD
ncbi:tetratricopeptide repeat-containing diguanylate cyclase [Psychromonas sp. PT13]|uniref:tetratricopeptide repeat-containing diguanylate cyclase n=1 Tax=Psychromonas sp. PT13 TaxID=3439547 RepID=UPI003EBC2A97